MTICGVCGLPCSEERCPTCKAEGDKTETVIGERFRRDREEKARLIRDLEEWLRERESRDEG